MNLHFKRNLSIGFGLSLVILIISTAASVKSISELVISSEDVAHTNRMISDIEGTISTLKDAETGQRGFLLTGKDVFLEPYIGAYDSARILIARIKASTKDNLDQQSDCILLKEIITQRISVLDTLIAQKRNGELIITSSLFEGKKYMDSARLVVKRMIERERGALAKRTDRLNQFRRYSVVLIIIAAFLAIIITIVFYLRVRNDFKERERLEMSLRKADKETKKRIANIEEVSNKISSGNYGVRVTDEKNDSLGALGNTINDMAKSLQFSFGTLSDKEWIQTGLTQLSEKMLGQQDVRQLTNNIITYLTNYTRSEVGALYLNARENELHLASSYALNADPSRSIVRYGEGIIGQCAKSGKPIIVADIPSGHLSISFASANIKPSSLIVVPITNEGTVTGVIELASLRGFTLNDKAFLSTVSESVGIVIEGALSRTRMQELLEETQTQAEELQTQHTELETINTELEIKSEKLQSSEEELKVQQEEILQANKELEERAALLEEKNQLIIESNVQIRAKAEELALSSKYKSEFLANMSHELRTPLNSILLLSGLMAENSGDKLGEEEVEYARVIQSSGNGLLVLIDEILDLSKIESGKMDLLIEQVAITDIVSNMQDLFSVFAREKQLKFSIQKNENVPATLETDKLRLEQILKNLISNAFKFTPKNGSVSLSITLENEYELRFAVRDTGIGIPPEKQQLIFEAFQQADGSTRRKYGGTGLGLSISRELVRLLGGEITLSSEVDKGSEFSVIVPVSKASAPAQQLPVEQPLKNVVIPASNGSKKETEFISPLLVPEAIPDDRHSLSPGDKLILIIEDDPVFAKVLLDFTRKNNYKGIVVVKGDDGINFARQLRPTGILLDLMLPVKTGWEVMEELKTDPLTRHIPVHIMSAQDGRRESMMRGAVDFINKPVALEQLKIAFQRIELVLNRNPKKVLIVEENNTHAQALSYYLESSRVKAEIKSSIDETIETLQGKDVDCVILDMQMADSKAYDVLEKVKGSPGLENLPIIIFTGKHLSRTEESRIRQYADSIVVKTAHSYQRILDEVSLFLHIVEESSSAERNAGQYKRLGMMNEVLKDKTVLIADDDVQNIYSLTKALENYKMKVYSATDGKEALAKLETTPVDVVLIDMMMPELDGYETTRLIRKHSRLSTLPVLALTAKSMSGDREKCIQAGASDYISKPVDIDQLLSLLRVWLYAKQNTKP